MRSKFPKDFLWGAASAAYQVEGAYNVDGKGPSVWDEFVEEEGRTFKGTTGKLAVDHYHRYKEDIALMAELGLKTYRFSIAWSRIFPTGNGEVNQAGVDFYSNLIDELLKHDIEPMVTIYHWDLPQALLEQYGGWESSKIIDDFTRFSKVLFDNYSDRVKYWITMNEQNVFIMMGYLTGEHPPGVQDPQRMFLANHFANLANAAAIKAFREGGYEGMIGPSVAYSTIYAASPNPEDVVAADNLQLLANDFWLDVYLKGEYPPLILAMIKEQGFDWQPSTKETRLLKEGKPDFIGVNYYRSMTVAHNPKEGGVIGGESNYSGKKGSSSEFGVPGLFKVVANPNLEATNWDWEIDPQGLRLGLRRIYSKCKLPVIISENGLGEFDKVLDDGSIKDDYRIEYIKQHVLAVQEALSDGVPVLSYCVWSFTDLLSWLNGYQKRYGLVYVDRDEESQRTLQRIKKDSFYWYKKVITTNGDCIFKD